MRRRSVLLSFHNPLGRTLRATLVTTPTVSAYYLYRCPGCSRHTSVGPLLVNLTDGVLSFARVEFS